MVGVQFSPFLFLSVWTSPSGTDFTAELKALVQKTTKAKKPKELVLERAPCFHWALFSERSLPLSLQTFSLWL